MSCVLSDKNILDAINNGKIIIEPFNNENLSTSSYDVTLGNTYFRENKNDIGFFNPYDQESVKEVWGEPLKAKTCKELGLNLNNVSEDQEIIILNPGETILAHTNEYIGGLDRITTMMKARSSIGRCFIEVCKCAGWGDVGYTNRWTMEITNNSKHYSIPILVGYRIAQIVFLNTGEILSDTYEKTGKYQTSSSLEELQKNWSPYSMLPKLYLD